MSKNKSQKFEELQELQRQLKTTRNMIKSGEIEGNGGEHLIKSLREKIQKLKEELQIVD